MGIPLYQTPIHPVLFLFLSWQLSYIPCPLVHPNGFLHRNPDSCGPRHSVPVSGIKSRKLTGWLGHAPTHYEFVFRGFVFGFARHVFELLGGSERFFFEALLNGRGGRRIGNWKLGAEGEGMEPRCSFLLFTTTADCRLRLADGFPHLELSSLINSLCCGLLAPFRTDIFVVDLPVLTLVKSLAGFHFTQTFVIGDACEVRNEVEEVAAC